MSNQTKSEAIAVGDFKTAVAPIIDFLKHKFPDNEPELSMEDKAPRPKPWRRSQLYISDVVDCNGSQYADLVQEGGGVHGIALAGYTYVMEKMGVAFTKMAATSAGSINALLLSAVTTRSELRCMDDKCKDQGQVKAWDTDEQYRPDLLNADDYYETRSEKLLEYLAALDLSDFVDGHSSWRQLVLTTFKGAVKFENIKKYLLRFKNWFVFTMVMLVILIFSGLYLIFLSGNQWSNITLKTVYGVISAAFVWGLVFIVRQVIKGRKLLKNAPGFGINPGKVFEDWLKEKLEENGIYNVSQLKNKMQLEQACLRAAYLPRADKQPRTDFTYCDADAGRIIQRIAGLRSQLDAVQAGILGMKSGKGTAPAMEEEIDDLYSRIINTAKNILPGTPEKVQLAGELTALLMVLNKLRTKAVDDDKEDPVDISSAFKKEMAIVSSDITNEMKAEFPAMHKMYWGANYNISPAKYVRASMSIPGFFKPLQINYDVSQRLVMEKEWKDLLNIDLRLQEKDKYALMMDGGLLSNFPVNIFYNGDTPLPYKPTIGVKLQFEDDATSNYIETGTQLAGAMISTMRYFYDRDFMSKHNIFKKTVRSIDTGNIHWLNFDMSGKDKVELFFRGALTAAIFLMGAEDDNSRAESVQQLIQMGKKVVFKNGDFSLYADEDVCTFLTEDTSMDSVSFNWEQYKLERILLLGEQNMLKTRIKRKASYNMTK